MTATTLAPQVDRFSFAAIHPPDLVLPRTLLEALDGAGIAHRAGTFPHVDPDDAGTPVVYLVETERLMQLGDRRTIEHALELIESTGLATTIVISGRYLHGMGWLAQSPHIAGWLIKPLAPAAALGALATARRLLEARAEARRLRAVADQLVTETDRLLEIGVALSAERNLPKLYEMIVREARMLTLSDSGSLYLIEPGETEGERKLRFVVAQTGPDDAGKHVGAIMPLSRTSLSGYTAISGEVLRLSDAYEIPETAEYRFNNSFDKQTGYRTMSVLTVPMRDHVDAVVGVIMLINRKPSFRLTLESPEHTERVVRPFTERDESVLRSLASQAGIALSNRALLDSIQGLFEQFVSASVKAIEVRDKSTQGHSSRVAALTVAQAEAANAVETGIFANLHFDPDAMREMRYAALLHDFGKVAVPEYIFGKAKKLPDGKLDVIRLRFLLAINQVETLGARRKFDLLRNGGEMDDPRLLQIDADTASRTGELEALLATVESANEPRVVAAEIGPLLDSIIGKTYRDLDEERPLLEEPEFEFLRIARGSLSGEERKKMEDHVTQSFNFLKQIPWGQTPWRSVPEMAYGHHEHLDGTGYPRGLKGLEISPQVRMLTISDVFDALTASDRPYKAAMSIDRALDILVKEFAQRGKVDGDLLDLFIERKVYAPIMGVTPAS